MLDRAHRLRRRTDFTSTVRRGARAARGSVVVHLYRPGGADPPRAGFVVSRAVGGAVDRNRVKRRLRHAARDQLAGLPAGTTLVVRAQPAAAGASWTRLRSDLAAALRAAASPRPRRPEPAS